MGAKRRLDMGGGRPPVSLPRALRKVSAEVDGARTERILAGNLLYIGTIIPLHYPPQAVGCCPGTRQHHDSQTAGPVLPEDAPCSASYGSPQYSAEALAMSIVPHIPATAGNNRLIGFGTENCQAYGATGPSLVNVTRVPMWPIRLIH